MDRRRFLAHLGLAAAAASTPWLAACHGARSLTVAIHIWVGYEPLYLARDFKWLPEAVKLLDDPTFGQSLAALKSGVADAGCMTLDEMLRARADGLPLSAALVFDVSAGADMVLVRQEIKTLADLKGKRIGFDHGAVGALVFEKLMEAAGLPASAVTQVNLPAGRHLEAWRDKEVDAVITYDPMASHILHEGGVNLFDSRQMPDTIIDVLAVRRDRIGSMTLLRDLVAGHFRALAYMRTHEQDTIRRISAREDLTPEEVRLALAGVTLPTLAANRGYLLGPDPGLVRAAKAISALMVRRDLLPQADDLDKLVLPDALPDRES